MLGPANRVCDDHTKPATRGAPSQIASWATYYTKMPDVWLGSTLRSHGREHGWGVLPGWTLRPTPTRCMAGEYSPAKHAHNIDDVCGWGVLTGRMEHQGGKAREYSLAQPLGSSKTWLGSTPRPSHLGQARYGWGVFPGPAGEYSPAEWNTKGARLGSTPMYGCCMFQALIFARGMYNYASRKIDLHICYDATN